MLLKLSVVETVPLDKVEGKPLEGLTVGVSVEKVPIRGPEAVLKVSGVETVALGEADGRPLEGPVVVVSEVYVPERGPEVLLKDSVGGLVPLDELEGRPLEGRPLEGRLLEGEDADEPVSIDAVLITVSIVVVVPFAEGADGLELVLVLAVPDRGAPVLLRVSVLGVVVVALDGGIRIPLEDVPEDSGKAVVSSVGVA